MLQEIEIANSNDVQSWFPENNFVSFNERPNEFVNFNVDGEIVKFSLDNIGISVIPSAFLSK
jgi:hypothetical protein